MAKTRNFAEVIRRKLAKDADLAALVEQESFNAHVATEIFNARESAGLTQADLATLVGTHQSVIARLESADYDGHSLSMLRRISQAVNKRLRVEFYAPLPFAQTRAHLRPITVPKWACVKGWKVKVSVKQQVRAKVLT